MTRTNIDLDDELLARAMKRTGAPTKKAVVDLALRRLVGIELAPEFLASLRGIGWDGDLDEMRSGPADHTGR
ncbi:MAG TPA: type II toxin-antitoxin system VapB family antitoxin [Actinomycetales bacterium]|nr:type II toxin-antitoxin system VapB family antitoxin [Actinomycetales bacterium]